MFTKTRDFFKDVQGEFNRVQWPTRDATLKSTGLVLVLSLIISIFLGVVDLGLAEMIKWIIAS